MWANSQLWQVWCYCLLRSNHEDQWVTVKTGRGETEVLVKSGQFLFGRKSAGKTLRQKPTSVYNRLKKLKKLGNVDIQPDTHFSIVTICNWSIYQKKDKAEEQVNGQPTDKQLTGNGQPTDTNKNDKKEKNDKNEKKQLFLDCVKLTPDEHKKLIDKFGEADTREKIKSLNNYVMSKGTKYKSHYHTVLSWANKNGTPPKKKTSAERLGLLK